MAHRAGEQPRTRQGYTMKFPDWLQKYKNDWVTRGRLSMLVKSDEIAFTKWFDVIKPRLKTVKQPSNNRNGDITLYLVKEAWAKAKAHGVELMPNENIFKENAEMSMQRRITELERENFFIRKQFHEVSLESQSIKTKYETRPHDFLPQAPIVHLLLTATPPRPVPGVYFLISGLEVVYVGQSERVLGRMAGHMDKEFDEVRMIEVPDRDSMLALEGKLISLLRPKYNKTTPNSVRAIDVSSSFKAKELI